MRSGEREVAEATARLAQFVADTGYDDLPPAVRERARLITADTLGVALRGSLEPEVQRLHSQRGEGQGATLFREGLPRRDPVWAAFANATAACFLELDEACRPSGHPGLHTVFPALALSQALSRSGQEYLAALALGYEVQARVGAAARLRWPVHPHGNMGHAGAVAALGKLSGWDPGQIRHGINAAAALAGATSWTPCLVGATVRNAYPGLTAQTAFTVKTLIESGFTGYEGALGETFGQILGEDFDADALAEGLGERYRLLDGYFKFHAACAYNHPPLDALADALGATPRSGEYPPLLATSRPKPEEVRRVRVRVPERFTKLAVQPRGNQLSAKFSIPHAMAAYLARGSADLDSFRGEILADEQVRALASRVEVIADRGITARWPVDAAAEVEVELVDGRVLVGSCSNPFGSAPNPAPVTALRAKFQYLVSGVLGEAETEALWVSATNVDAQPDMSRFPF